MAKEKPATKLCKYCKTEIPYEAKICPQCRKKQKGGFLKWALIFLAAIVILGAISGKGKKTEIATSQKTTTESTQKIESSKNTPKQTENESATEEKTDLNSLLKELKIGEKNAVLSAINYLQFTAFSREGLINQLSSEYGDGYSLDEATFAVNFLENHNLVDWEEQAIKSAKHYLSFTAFSRKGLINQLSSEYGERFTEEQASKAVAYLEGQGLVDWKEQAVKSAKNYLSFSSFSKAGLIEQLSSDYGEGFTREEAEYAAEQVGY